ncbi:MAG: YbfB/YjiJ family MFS transporter, partial [Halioglobus sp.]|nr:YbfB/YjiJ family MFS transporter [Halioglobus sp.]
MNGLLASGQYSHLKAGGNSWLCWSQGPAYTLMSIGVVPHTLFLADYMHRDLGVSIKDSSSLFGILGIGCAVGANYVGTLIRRLGARLSLSNNYTLGAAAIAIVLIFDSVIIVASSSFVIG